MSERSEACHGQHCLRGRFPSFFARPEGCWVGCPTQEATTAGMLAGGRQRLRAQASAVIVSTLVRCVHMFRHDHQVMRTHAPGSEIRMSHVSTREHLCKVYMVRSDCVCDKTMKKIKKNVTTQRHTRSQRIGWCMGCGWSWSIGWRRGISCSTSIRI